MAVACDACGETFDSRNALFRHLRSSAGSCRAEEADDVASTSSAPALGKKALASVFGRLSGNTEGAPARAGGRKRECDMSKDEIRALNARRRARAERRKDALAAAGGGEDASERELWIGGLRGRATTRRGFADAIWRAMPVGCGYPAPQVKTVHARAYRVDGEWVGYGFAAARDEAEAGALMRALDGTIVELDDGVKSTLKVRPACPRKGSGRTQTPTPTESRVGEHPDEREIFLAWTSKALERRAIAREMTQEELVVDAMTRERSYINLRGVQVNADATSRLKDELFATKWPAQSHRKSVRSEGYIVLKRDTFSDDPYKSLKLACEELMQSVDPSFPYDSLAITSGFTSSPHVDKEDQSFQYSMSFGDFSGGGELCVESRDGTTRYAIDTRERLAKFDGRSVHWVRSFSGKRFSVVWYVNRVANFTEQAFDVDLSFVDS